MKIVKVLMKARLASAKIYKFTVSRLKMRYKKYHRIIINKDDFYKIRNQDDFICSIQLARLVNTIRSAQSNYLRIPDNGKLPNTKDRIEQQYILASILYEALKSFLDFGGVLKNLKTWKTNSKLTKYLHKEWNGKTSYFRTVLEPIRNKVMFHFEREAITEAFEKIPIKERIDLAVSESMLTKDMVFKLVNELILNYIISKDIQQINDMEKYEYLLKYITDISEKLINLAEECVLEIWQKYAYKDKRRLE